MLENSIKYYELMLKEKKKQQMLLSLQIKAVEEELELYKLLDKEMNNKWVITGYNLLFILSFLILKH